MGISHAMDGVTVHSRDMPKANQAGTALMIPNASNAAAGFEPQSTSPFTRSWPLCRAHATNRPSILEKLRTHIVLGPLLHPVSGC